MSIRPIDVYTMPPKSQETSQIQKNGQDRLVNGEQMSNQQYHNNVNNNVRKTVQTKDKDDKGFRFDAKEKGHVSTVFGRRRPVPELSSSNFMQRQFGERIAMNAPIQGTAADVMKIAMVRVDRELRRQRLSSRIVLQVHDELLLEVPADEEEQVKALVREAMMGAAQMAVPLEIEIQSGKSWYETK